MAGQDGEFGRTNEPVLFNELKAEVSTSTQARPVQKQSQTPTPERLPENLAELEAAMMTGYQLESVPPQAPDLATELRAVLEAVNQFNYRDGKPCVCYPSLLQKIMKIAAFYNKNGFQVAAELYRVWQQVQRAPSVAPEYPAWFLAVLEARFQRSHDTRKPIAMRVKLPVVQSSVVEEGEWAGEFTRRLLEELKANNRMVG